MTVVIAEGEVVVTADGKNIGPMVARDVEGNQAPIVGAGRTLGASILKGIVAYGLISKTIEWFRGSISGASDLAETMSKSTVIFGDNAAAIDTWASRASLNIGLSRQAALDAAAGFGDMFSQIGFSGDEAAAASTKVVQMAADLGSFSNLDTADVSDRIAAAFRGEYDSLQKVIPNINAARVEKEALALSGKTLTSELTSQEKAQAVLNIIQSDGARAMGDFARTQDGFANSSKTATAQMADMQTEIGVALLPVMNQLLGFLLTYIIPALADFAKWVGENTGWLGPLAVALGVAAAAIWLVNIAMYANPIGLIIAGVVLLIGVIVALVLNWDTVVKFLGDTWAGFVGWFTGVMEGFAGWWTGVWDGFIGFVVDVWNGFVGWITDTFNLMVLGFQIIGATLLGWWNGLWIGVGMAVLGAVGFVSDTWNGFVGWLGSIPQAIGNALGAVGSFIINAFRGPLNTVVDIWNNTLGRISLTIPGWVPGIGGQTWAVPKLPHFAQGTRNAPGGWALAGEYGPELVNLNRGSRVYTASETMGALAGNKGGDVHIGSVVIDAKNVREFADVVDMVKALPQVARTGRGSSVRLAG